MKSGNTGGRQGNISHGGLRRGLQSDGRLRETAMELR